MLRFEGIACPRNVAENEREGVSRNKLEALDPVGPALEIAKQCQRRLGIADAGPADDPLDPGVCCSGIQGFRVYPFHQ